MKRVQNIIKDGLADEAKRGPKDSSASSSMTAFSRQVELVDLSSARPLRPRNTGYTPRESFLSSPSTSATHNPVPSSPTTTPKRRPSSALPTSATPSPPRPPSSSVSVPPSPLSMSPSNPAPPSSQVDKATAQLNQVLSRTRLSSPSSASHPATPSSESPQSSATSLSNFLSAELLGASTTPISPERREDLFRTCLSATSVDVDELRRLVWAHGLPPSSTDAQSSAPWIRPLTWKLLTGYLPPDRSDWANALTVARATYWGLVHDATVDPSARPVDGDHPLNDEHSSQWREFFQDADVRDLIARDARRTHPELDSSQPSTPSVDMKLVRDALERILFVYAKTHDAVGYRQGMNELAAPFLIVFFAEDHPSGGGSVNGGVANSGMGADVSDIEADAYFCFQAIMKEMETCYVRESENEGIGRQLRELQALLRIKDPQLERYLDDLGIDPRFYGLRWLRLWVIREFKLHDALALWDSFLTAEVRLPWIRYVCAAMLIRIRHLLLNADFTKCMKLLLHYPPCNIPQLLRIADGLRTSNAVIVRTARS